MRLAGNPIGEWPLRGIILSRFANVRLDFGRENRLPVFDHWQIERATLPASLPGAEEIPASCSIFPASTSISRWDFPPLQFIFLNEFRRAERGRISKKAYLWPACSRAM